MSRHELVWAVRILKACAILIVLGIAVALSNGNVFSSTDPEPISSPPFDASLLAPAEPSQRDPSSNGDSPLAAPTSTRVPTVSAQRTATRTATRPAKVAPPAPTATPKPQVAAALRSSPIMFIENVGQFGKGARFQVRGASGNIFLAEDAIWMSTVESAKTTRLPTNQELPLRLKERQSDVARKGVNVKLAFVGANPSPRLESFNRLSTRVSYFVGKDKSQWRTDVPVWGGVRYKDLYPGIDLEITSDKGQLVQRLVVRSGANLSAVRLRVNGTDSLETDGSRLKLNTSVGALALPLFQLTSDGKTLPSKDSPSIKGNEIIAPFGAPMTTSRRSLSPTGAGSIPPMYSTFLGGIYGDEGWSITGDASGAAYVVGSTDSYDFPTTPGAFISNGPPGAFVVKLNAQGSALDYAAILGPASAEDIVVDDSGAAYIVGDAGSDFPTTVGAYDTTFNGGTDDAFVAKLNATGSDLIYSTFLGGSSGDAAVALAVDSTGAAYVTGRTSSSNFTTTVGAFDRIYNAGDAFVVKLNPSGANLAYATFLGGTDWDTGKDITINASGEVFVTGDTRSIDFPVTLDTAYDSTCGGCSSYEDVFITHLNANGSALIYSTFLGGSNLDWAAGIAVDEGGAMYVAGSTKSADFPTDGGFDTTCGGCSNNYADAFVTKLNSTGSALVYSTYLGGSLNDWGIGMVINGSGNVFNVGVTCSTDFPVTPGAFQATKQQSPDGYCDDLFLTVLTTDGSALVSSTYIGGGDLDDMPSIAIDRYGFIYLTGYTISEDFPITPAAFDTIHNGIQDAFAMKLSSDLVLLDAMTFNLAKAKGNLAGDPRICPLQCQASDAIYSVGDPINTRTGAIDYSTVDLSFPALGGQMVFQRSYSSLATSLYNSTLGYGWTHNQDTRLILPTDPGGIPGQILFKPHNANQLTFYANPNGTYTPHPGVLAKLISTTVPAGYTVTASDQSTYAFDAAGRLQTWADAQGHAWTYSYTYYTYTLSAGPNNVATANDIVDDPSYGQVAWQNPSNGMLPDSAVASVSGGVGESHFLKATNFGFGVPSNAIITGVEAQLLVQSSNSPRAVGLVKGGSVGYLVGGEQDIGGGYFSFGGPTYLWNTTLTPSDVNATNFGAAFTGVVSFGGYHYVDHIRMIVYYTLPNVLRLTRVQDSTGTRYLNLGYDAHGRISNVSDPLGRSVQYGYDANGDLSTVTDARGKVWTYQYDGTSHRLNRILDPLSNTVEQTEYDAQGRAVRQFDGLGTKTIEIQYNPDSTRVISDGTSTVVTATYSSRGTLAYLQAAAGQTEKQFDANFRPYRTTDPNSNSTQLTWSADGANLTRVIDAKGLTTSLHYDSLNNLTRTVDAKLRASNFTYDGKLLKTSTDAQGNTTFYTYTAQGFLSAMSDTRGNTTSYAYNQLGQRTSMTDSVGSVTSWQYDNAGRVITTTDAAGRMTVNTYDNGDNLTKVTQNYLAGQVQNYQNQYNIVTQYGYNDAGHRTAITDTLGRVSLNAYDANGRLIKLTQNYQAGQPQNYQNEFNIITQYGNDLAGRQVLITDTMSHVSRNTFDSAGRLATATQNYWSGHPQNYQNQYNLVTTYAYDSAGNTTMRTDTLDRRTVTQYDELNRPVTVTVNYIDGLYDPVHPDEDLISLTTYDAVGNIETTTDPSGRVSRTVYDDLNRPSTVTANYWSGQPQNYQNQYNIVTQYGYDSVGNRVAITDTLGRVTLNEYDSLNRVLRVTQNPLAGQPQNWLNENNLVTTYGYDAIGNRVAITDTLSRVSRSEYDTLNRLTAQVDAMNGRTTYVYDALGYRMATTDALSRTTTSTYDTLNRLIRTTQPLTTITQYIYDALGNKTRVIDPRSYSTYYAYDALNRNTSVTDANNHTSTTTFDAAGRRTSQTDALGHTTTFSYDLQDHQLTATDALTHTTSYGYDASGNRTSVTDANTIATKFGYDKLSRLISVTENYVQGGATDNQTNVRTQYTYDALGNRTNITDGLSHPTSFTYDTLNRLKTESDALGYTTVYTYNPVGSRTVLHDPKNQQTLYTYDNLDRPSSIIYANTDMALALQGPNHVTSVNDIVNYGTGGNCTGAAWTDPGNGRTSDDIYATVPLSPTRFSQCLVANNFRFAIPSSATITGILLLLEKSATITNTVKDSGIWLVKGGAIQFNGWNRPSGQFWPVADSDSVYYGGINDLWGVTVTPADINNVGFGVAIRAMIPITATPVTAKIDNIMMRIYFTLGSPRTTNLGYDAVGNRILMTDTFGITQHTYDDLNRLTQVRDPNNRIVGYEYDGNGNRTSLTYPDNKLVRYSYDPINQMTAVQDWNSRMTYYGYDAANRPITSTLPNSVTSSYTFDNANRLTTIGYDRGSTTLARMNYTVDAVGNRTQQSESILAVESGILGPSELPSQQVFIPFLSQGAGNTAPLAIVGTPTPTVVSTATVTPTQRAAPSIAATKTATLTTTPTLLKSPSPTSSASPTSTQRPSPSTTASPPHLSTPTLTKTLTLTPTATTPSTLSATRTITPTKSAGSQPFGVVLAAYAFETTPTRTTTPKTSPANTKPAPSRQPSAIPTATKTTVAPIVPTSTRLIPQQISPTAALTKPPIATRKPPVLLPSATPTRTQNNKVTPHSPDSGDTTIAYVYDPLYRLTRATFTGSYTGTFVYTYDAVGNRLTQNVNGVGTNYTYDNANRLTRVNSQTYTWDANGNLISDGPSTYTYFQSNRLRKVTKSGANYIFVYDDQGNRYGQYSNTGAGGQYALDINGSLTQVLIWEILENTTYLYGMGRIGQQTTSMQYFGADALGSVRQMYNSNGEVIANKRYDPFGNVVAQNGVGTSMFGFAGEQTDATGLEYLRARYYAPKQGRFTTRDVWEGDPNQPMSYNAWNYVNANPVNLSDPSGERPSECDELRGSERAKCIREYYESLSGKTAYLTFDDGPDPSYTAEIALKLQDQGALATFFVKGTEPDWERIYSKCNPSVSQLWANQYVARLIKGAGHALGIHGWVHENMWDLKATDPAKEVKQVEDALKAMGVSPDHLLRAPGGAFPADAIKGYEDWFYYGWDIPETITAIDGYGISAEAVISRLESQLKATGKPENPIILLHSIQKGTRDAVVNTTSANRGSALLDKLRELGYRQFKVLPRSGDKPGYPPNGKVYFTPKKPK